MIPLLTWTNDEENDEEDVESKIGFKNFLKNQLIWIIKLLEQSNNSNLRFLHCSNENFHEFWHHFYLVC